MYSTILCKKLASGCALHDLCRTSTIVVDSLNRSAKSFSRLSGTAFVYENKPSFLRRPEPAVAAACRHYCKEYRPFPEVPEFPPVVWPNLFKSVRALVYTYMIIKPQLDRDFSLGEFAKNSRKVLDGYRIHDNIIVILFGIFVVYKYTCSVCISHGRRNHCCFCCDL